MSARKNRSNLLKSLIFIVIFLISMTSSQLTASAHPLSASYTTVTFDKDKTDFSFSLDVISIIESMDNVDMNGNGILEENEIESNKHRLEEWIEDSVILEMNDQQQAPELQDLFLDKKGDKEVLTWNFTYPAFVPGQTIAINDGLYSQATSSPYVNLITAHNGNQTSETVMQGKDRTWTMLLTEDQQEQQLSSSTNSSSSGNSGSSSDWFSFSNWE